MTSKKTEASAVEPLTTAAKQRAVGALVIGGIQSIFTDWRTWVGIGVGAFIVIGKLVAGQMYPGLVPVPPPAPVQITPLEIHQLIKGVHETRDDVVEIKVEMQASIDALPPAQKKKTLGLISDRMAVVRLTEHTGGE